MKVLQKILKDLNGASSGAPGVPRRAKKGLNEALGRPIRPYGGPRGPRGGSRGPQGPWVFRGPLELKRLQIAGAPKAKASVLGHIFEDFQAIMESLNLRGTQLEPTKSL